MCVWQGGHQRILKLQTGVCQRRWLFDLQKRVYRKLETSDGELISEGDTSERGSQWRSLPENSFSSHCNVVYLIGFGIFFFRFRPAVFCSSLSMSLSCKEKVSLLFNRFFFILTIIRFIYLFFYQKVIVCLRVVNDDTALHLLYGVRRTSRWNTDLVVGVYLSGVACTDEVSSLFRGELNPVAAKAQKKVQIPEGQVDTFFYCYQFLLVISF